MQSLRRRVPTRLQSSDGLWQGAWRRWERERERGWGSRWAWRRIVCVSSRSQPADHRVPTPLPHLTLLLCTTTQAGRLGVPNVLQHQLGAS